MVGPARGAARRAQHLGDWLKANQVTHITAEELKFVAIQKGEVIVSQILQLLEQSTGDTASLMRRLEESATPDGAAPDDAAAPVCKSRWRTTCPTLPPYQLKELFEAKLPETVEKSGLREEVAPTSQGKAGRDLRGSS